MKDFRSNSRIGKGYADTILIDPFDLSTLGSWKSRLYRKIFQFPPFRRRFVDLFLKLNESHFQQTQIYKDLYYTTILADWFSNFREKYNLPDTLVGNPQDTVSIGGHRIGRSYLSSFLRIHNYSKVIDFSRVESVFEIGGGFGAFAHTLLHCFPNIKKYLYLDIPPILYVGTKYLQHFYGDSVVDYKGMRNSEVIQFSSADKREILAVCPWQIERINADFDVFCNSASFQEMTENTVANYVRHTGHMLKDKNSKLCLNVYKGGNPEKTLLPEDLCRIVENNIPIEFEELEPEVAIDNAHYFFGTQKIGDTTTVHAIESTHSTK